MRVYKLSEFVHRADYEFCQTDDCGKPTIAIVQGDVNCYYCGHHIAVCRDCLRSMTIEAMQLLI